MDCSWLQQRSAHRAHLVLLMRVRVYMHRPHHRCAIPHSASAAQCTTRRAAAPCQQPRLVLARVQARGLLMHMALWPYKQLWAAARRASRAQPRPQQLVCWGCCMQPTSTVSLVQSMVVLTVARQGVEQNPLSPVRQQGHLLHHQEGQHQRQWCRRRSLAAAWLQRTRARVRAKARQVAVRQRLLARGARHTTTEAWHRPLVDGMSRSKPPSLRAFGSMAAIGK